MKHKNKDRRPPSRKHGKQLAAKQTGRKKPTPQKQSKLKRKAHTSDQEGDPAFLDTHSVLLVGEGNLTFARALARSLSGQGAGLVATAYDSADVLEEKYEEGDDPVSGVLQELLAAGARVKCGIDATNLKKNLMANKKAGGLKEHELAFDRVVFNFPHAGLGIKDQDINIRKNQALLAGFFQSSCEVLHPEGEIHVTLKQGQPYDSWNIVGTAHQATGGLLELKRSFKFDASKWSGYTHRRTLGFKQGVSASGNEEVEGRSRTYVFAPNARARKQAMRAAGKRMTSAQWAQAGAKQVSAKHSDSDSM